MENNLKDGDRVYVQQKYEEFLKYYVGDEIPHTPVRSEMLEKSLGQVLMDIIKLDPLLRAALDVTESRAVKALENIKRILNDHTLEDPECFQRIEKIIRELEEAGIFTDRHDF